MSEAELERVQEIAYEELIGIADDASLQRWNAYEAFITRLRREFGA